MGGKILTVDCCKRSSPEAGYGKFLEDALSGHCCAMPCRVTDETYIKVRGKWTYLYRAVDRNGQTLDFMLSERRDLAAPAGF